MLKGIITFINIQIEQHFLHNRNNDPVLSKQFALFLADISGRKSANFSCLKRKSLHHWNIYTTFQWCRYLKSTPLKCAIKLLKNCLNLTMTQSPSFRRKHWGEGESDRMKTGCWPLQTASQFCSEVCFPLLEQHCSRVLPNLSQHHL